MRHTHSYFSRASAFVVMLCMVFSLFLSPVDCFAGVNVGKATVSNQTLSGDLLTGYDQSIIYFNQTTNEILAQIFDSSNQLYRLSPGKYYRLYFGSLSYHKNTSAGLSFDAKPYVIINGQRFYIGGFSSLVISGFDVDNLRVGFEISGYARKTAQSAVIQAEPTISNLSFEIFFDELSDSEVASSSVQSEINNSIKQGNQLQQEANQTGKGILGKITDFFGSFFENIINALKSLFIPEDGYFSDFFTRLNDFFSEKLGFLYEPIELFLDFLNAIQNASVGASPGLTFPEIKWQDDVIVPETRVDFAIVQEKMPDLQEKIYFVTDIIMVGAVLILLEKKINEVMHR